MIKKILGGSLLGLTCSLSSIAGTMGEVENASALPFFYVGAFGGYGVIDGGYHGDGSVAQARLTFGTYAWQCNRLQFGAELGIQSGNTMRLDTSQSIIDTAGGLPIQSTLKPLLDALVTVQYPLNTSRPIAAILKGGIAYRQLQLDDRSSVQDNIDRVNGEFQAGIGFGLCENTRITLLYQGIYSSNRADIQLNSIDDIVISSIPTQQAGFLGVEYSF